MKTTMDKLPNYIPYFIDLVVINAVNAAAPFNQYAVVHQALPSLLILHMVRLSYPYFLRL